MSSVKDITMLVRSRLHRASRKLHECEHGLHVAYLGSVAVFAHGVYAYVAGALCVAVVLVLVAEEEQ